MWVIPGNSLRKQPIEGKGRKKQNPLKHPLNKLVSPGPVFLNYSSQTTNNWTGIPKQALLERFGHGSTAVVRNTHHHWL